MKTIYYVGSFGYDKDYRITDYGLGYGYFDTYEEAYELFVKLQCRDVKSFFENAPDIYQLLIQLEECEADEDAVNCVDVKNEWWIVNPNFEEEE